MAQFDRREVLVASLGAGALAQARPSFARRLPRDSGSATIANLRVCGLERPLALADRVPRFAWQLQGAAPGLLQRAFRIVVAASREDLQSGRNLAWDSGQVRSAATVDVAYRGLPTPSRNRRWWRVESWVAGRDTPLVSEAAFWETGLMPGDWTSGWLACENEIARLDRAEGIHWITAPQRVSIGSTCHLRSIIDSDRDRSAELLLAAVELDGLWLNGEPLISAQDEPVSWTTMASFALPLRRGPNVIAASVKRGRGFGAQPAMLASIVRLDGAAGPRLSSSSGWKASLDAPEGWRSPDFGDETWADAAPVTAKVTGEPWPAYPAVYLRRSFTLSRTVRSARLYATALGVYDAWLNGRPVSDARMAPQSTDPSLRLLYQAYDVSGLVKRGDNMIGLCVGDGWYASEFSSGSR
jgi:alpha-L-rhamnosidase